MSEWPLLIFEDMTGHEKTWKNRKETKKEWEKMGAMGAHPFTDQNPTSLWSSCVEKHAKTWKYDKRERMTRAFNHRLKGQRLSDNLKCVCVAPTERAKELRICDSEAFGWIAHHVWNHWFVRLWGDLARAIAQLGGWFVAWMGFAAS